MQDVIIITLSFIIQLNLAFTNYNSTALFSQVHNTNTLLLKGRMIGNIRYYFYNNDSPIRYRAERMPLSKWVNKLKWTKRVSLGELWDGQQHNSHTVTHDDDEMPLPLETGRVKHWHIHWSLTTTKKWQFIFLKMCS